MLGRRNGTGFRYFARNPSLYSVNPVKKVPCETVKANAELCPVEMPREDEVMPEH